MRAELSQLLSPSIQLGNLFRRHASRPPRLSLPALPLMRLLLLLSILVPGTLGAAVSFTNDIAPIFAQKCIACHGEKRAKGSFQLHTFDALTKGVKGERVFVAGKPEASSLYELLISKDEDSRMPQNDDPLPAAQIALIKQWIDE